MKFFDCGGICRCIVKTQALSWLKSPGPAIRRKIIMRINFIAFLLLITIMNVSASVLAQQVTLSFEKAPLEKVLIEIQKQTGYEAWYNDKYLEHTNPITIKIRNGNLKEALDQCFKDQPLVYELLDKVIVIKPKKEENNKGKSGAIEITGKVVDKDNQPLPGVTVKVKGTDLTRITGSDGIFNVTLLRNSARLVFSSVGYATKEVDVNNNVNDLVVVLDQEIAALQEVNIVSTGYQAIPKERATGSFVQIDNDLLNRRVGMNILDRLEGVTSGVMFPNNNIQVGANESAITVRGRSTILANAKPLIVVDNFPFQGDINTINPNDIESITVLKDAAAASIWGAFSGNGVIVINTKKGKLSQKLSIDYNGSYTVGGKPDLFYDKRYISAAEYIDVEKFMFSKGFYDASLNNTSNRPLISPVVELLDKARKGLISNDNANAQIAALQNFDYRKDFEKYLYQNSQLHQHAINLNGGSNNASYYFSGGFDNNETNLVGNNFKRYSLNTYDTFIPLKGVEVFVGLTYTQSLTQANNPGRFNPGNGKTSYYPYTRLADDNGTLIPVDKDYRLSYIRSTGNGNLLDWTYNPVSEINSSDNWSRLNHIRMNSGLKYSFFKSLNAEVRYQYESSQDKNENYNSTDTYFTRNLINRYTQITGSTITRPVPLGGIMELKNSEITTNNIRGQLNFNETFFKKYSIAALAGVEQRESRTQITSDRIYGYDKNTLGSIKVNVVQNFPIYGDLGAPEVIPYTKQLSGLNDVWISYFGNTSVNYDNRYIFSGSFRIDQSNIFGAKTNNRGIPLWSAGLKWNLSNEHFYNFTSVPNLSVRASYGYNGNIDRSTSAVLVGIYSVANSAGLPTISLSTPPNPELRWEKTGIFNLGIDFSTAKNLISGSIEYYKKYGKDLLGQSPLPTLTGFTTYNGNVANMRGEGIDIDISGNVTVAHDLRWRPSLLFSYNIDKVTSYNVELAKITYAQSGPGYSSGLAPSIGHPVYSIFSYKWAGLNNTGNPQGIIGNEASTNYLGILTGNGTADLAYTGSARPTYFGAFRNSLSYKNLSLSVNITYKLGYYFRKSSIDYSLLVNNGSMHADYLTRWKQPGDEQFTDVPAFTYPIVSARETFYTYSEATVRKGDHIRLQDIQLNYEFGNAKWLPNGISRLNVYVYANNLGLIYRANNEGIDPDFLSGYPNPKTLSLGLKINY